MGRLAALKRNRAASVKPEGQCHEHIRGALVGGPRRRGGARGVADLARHGAPASHALGSVLNKDSQTGSIVIQASE